MSNLRKRTASEGMVYTDLKTEMMRAKFLFLGIEDSEENYKEIPENTPLPEIDVENDEATTADLYGALAKLGVE